ncbi:MAG: 30S ribosome-binding factor RbfA [Opitutaceae bacterium]
MSKRISKVNALLQREISEQMRRYYRAESAPITISEVSTSVDLRNANAYYAVLGDDAAISEARQFFRKNGNDLRRRVSKVITMKYFPRLEFLYDPSLERGAEILDLLDELDEESRESSE